MNQESEITHDPRSFWGGALVAVAGLLAALALVYTNASGVGAVAEEAQVQQSAESALGAASAARNALGQALLLAATPDAEPAVVAAAIEEVEGLLDALAARVDDVAAASSDPSGLEGAAGDVSASTAAALTAIARGDLDSAGAIASSIDEFERLVGLLVEIRDDAAVSIAATAAESGRVATASRFMVALVVPGVAVAIAWVIAHRRRRREDMARELRHERALNKSKDQLIANLSHELRTPLTGIYTSALTIEEVGLEDTDLALELTDVIIDQSADLTRMVEDLLVSAQADAGRLRFDLRSTRVASVTDGLAKELDRFDAEVSWDLAEGSVVVDDGRLRQLLRNLISNAAKYGGGRVEVRGIHTRSGYRIEVIDDGDGVPVDVEERMFERFIHRGDQPLIVGSVGLGLAISQVLAEGMHGSVSYERRDGLTVFAVDLAIDEEAAVPVDPLPTEPPALFDEEQFPIAELSELDLEDAVVEVLEAAGITSTAGLADMSTEDLLGIRGIGPARARQIAAALAVNDG